MSYLSTFPLHKIQFLADNFVLEYINKHLTKEEEMEIQERLKLAKLEIANLIQEGQRLRLANEQLQKDIDLRSRYIVNFEQI